MNIITNNQWRNMLYGYELPESVKSDFDYIDDIDSSDFIKYRGVYYSVCDFMRLPEVGGPDFGEQWDGYASDSFFSGVLIQLSPEDNIYKVATYIS